MIDGLAVERPTTFVLGIETSDDSKIGIIRVFEVYFDGCLGTAVFNIVAQRASSTDGQRFPAETQNDGGQDRRLSRSVWPDDDV